MREHFWGYPSRRQLWDHREIMLPKSENPIYSPIWLGQVPSLSVATPISETNQKLHESKGTKKPAQMEPSPEPKLERSSPKNNTSRRIHNWFIPNNRVKIQCIRHIISRSPTTITIFKTIIALRIWRHRGAACLACLSSRSAYFIRTSNLRSCWRFLQTEGVELDLYK